VPAVIISDCGTQFTSSLWVALCSLLKIQHSHTTAYHPQSNGMVERFHRCLKDALRAQCAAADGPSPMGPPRPPPSSQGRRRHHPRSDSFRLTTHSFYLVCFYTHLNYLLEQFSKTVSAAKHPSTRHNTAAARHRSCLMTSPAQLQCS
jgi:transposase InsO family protein